MSEDFQSIAPKSSVTYNDVLDDADRVAQPSCSNSEINHSSEHQTNTFSILSPEGRDIRNRVNKKSDKNEYLDPIVISDSESNKSQFPKFVSYNNDALIEEITPENPTTELPPSETVSSSPSQSSNPTVEPSASDNNRSSFPDTCFECNICFDNVSDPVVTRCGHLFCWSCLHAWLERGVFQCPVCKAGVTKENVIPLYGRGQDATDPRSKPQSAPQRPRAERPEPPPSRRQNNMFGGAQFSFGIFPFGIGISFSSDRMSGRIPTSTPDLLGFRPPQSEEQRAERRTWLLMLIGLMILFYLLFV